MEFLASQRFFLLAVAIAVYFTATSVRLQMINLRQLDRLLIKPDLYIDETAESILDEFDNGRAGLLAVLSHQF